MDRKDDLINTSHLISEIISHSDLDFYRFLYYNKWNSKLYFSLNFFSRFRFHYVFRNLLLQFLVFGHLNSIILLLLLGWVKWSLLKKRQHSFS